MTFTKPVAGTPIDTTNPMSVGLVSMVPLYDGYGNNFYDAATQLTYTAKVLPNSPTGCQPPTWYIPTDYSWGGPAIKNNAATAQSIQCTLTTQFVNNPVVGYSYAVLMQFNDSTTFGRIMDATNNAVVTLYQFAGSKVATTWRNASNSAIVPQIVINHAWHLVLCTVKDGLGVMYIDGVEVYRNTTVNLANSWANQTGLLCYNTTGNGAQMPNVNFSSWWIWNSRVLSAADAVTLSTNPWCMFI